MQYPIIDLLFDLGGTTITGKNLFSGEFRQGNYSNAGNQSTITTEDRPSGNVGETFTITINNLDFSRYKYVIFGTNRANGTSQAANPDSGWKTQNTASLTLSNASNLFIGISITTIDGSNFTPSDLPSNIEIQIEKGATATEYEKYISIEFPLLEATDISNMLKLPLPNYFPHPVIDALQRAAASDQTADDIEILKHYLTPLGIGGI